MTATEPPTGRAERIVFWITAVVAATVVWIPTYPPMVDLPQHAGQIRFLHDMFQSDFAWRDRLEINWITPYLSAEILGALLTIFMSAVAATKLVWTLATIGTVYTAVRVRRLLGGSSHWDWLVIPGLFGVTFLWGFLPFMVSVPLGLFTLERWILYLRDATARNTLVVIAMLLVMFVSHVLMTAWVMMVGGIMLLAAWRASGEGRVRGLLVRGLPLLTPLPLVAGWWLSAVPQTDSGSPTLWKIGADRFVEFFPQLLGLPGSKVAIIVGLLLFGLPVAAGGRPSRSPAHLAAVAVTLVIVMVVPFHLFGNAVTYNRFFTLLGPSVMFAMAGGAWVPSRLARLRVLIPVIAIGWTLLFATKMALFAAESEGFVQIVDRMEPGRRTLGLVWERGSLAADLPFAYLHFPVWYQARRGGLVDYNFATLQGCVVRFPPGSTSPIASGFEFTPDEFDWQRNHGWEFDYFLVRADTEDPPLNGRGLKVVAHEGYWWLFARAPVR